MTSIFLEMLVEKYTTSFGLILLIGMYFLFKIANHIYADNPINDLASMVDLKLVFCIRYIEASKSRLYHSESQARSSVSQAALLYVFGNILKMLHPFMPFVTEELWQVNLHIYMCIYTSLDAHFGLVYAISLFLNQLLSAGTT